MDEQEVLENRYRFFSDKAVALAVEHDKILVTLFTGIVAGLLVLLVSRELGFWSTLFLLLADLSAVVGLGACLMHMAFSAKVMGLLAAMFGGEQNVPNLVGSEEPTPHALTKNRASARLCYASQLGCLFWSVFFASLGVVAIVWDIIGWTGLIVALVLVAGLVVAVIRPLIWIYRAARIALARQTEELKTSDARRHTSGRIGHPSNTASNTSSISCAPENPRSLTCWPHGRVEIKWRYGHRHTTVLDCPFRRQRADGVDKASGEMDD